MQNHPIEDTFKKMCELSPRDPQYYYERYIVFKNVLIREFYDQIPSNYPAYTNHQYKHITGTLLQIDRISKNRVDCHCHDNIQYINLYELYLLLMSVIFHDVAMLVEVRENHSDITKILDLFDSIILPSEERSWIKTIVKCHQSTIKIEDEIPTKDKLINNWNVHPQFIAAILRLADALDENKRRSYEVGIALGTIPDDQLVYHEFARSIDGILPDAPNQKIKIEASIQKDALYKVFKKGLDDIIFINAFINEINKMNEERKYCMGFTEYYIEYRSVDLKLFIKNGTKNEQQITFDFDDRKNIDNFWETNESLLNRYK